jgi:hypothetical protein
MHVQVDPPPHVFEDEIGLKLAALNEGWRNRQDMNPQWTRRFRVAIVVRARFVEDLVTEQASRGIGQYVLLGAGLDTFAQRRPEIASRLRVFGSFTGPRVFPMLCPGCRSPVPSDTPKCPWCGRNVNQGGGDIDV